MAELTRRDLQDFINAEIHPVVDYYIYLRLSDMIDKFMEGMEERFALRASSPQVKKPIPDNDFVDANKTMGDDVQVKLEDKT